MGVRGVEHPPIFLAPGGLAQPPLLIIEGLLQLLTLNNVAE